METEFIKENQGKHFFGATLKIFFCESIKKKILTWLEGKYRIYWFHLAKQKTNFMEKG